MKITKLIVGLGITIAMVSCGSTKTTTTSSSSKKANTQIAPAKMIDLSSAIVVAKKGEMSKEEIQKWPHMDILTDSVPGMSTAKAYDFIKNKKGQTVIVGIIDAGVDLEHEDLKDVV